MSLHRTKYPAPGGILSALLLSLLPSALDAQVPAQPVIENGQAQVVPAFADSADWVRHDLWPSRLGSISPSLTVALQ